MYQQRHNRSSLCIEQIGDGEYCCRVTGVVIRTTTLPVICGLHAPHLIARITERECPYSQIVKRLEHDGLSRLDRCRSANCGMMHRVNGAITCVGMQGKKCGWQAKWIRCLNREEEFGCGGYECPHWLPSGEHSGQDNSPENDQDATEENKSTATAEKLT